MNIETNQRELKAHIWDRHPDDFYVEPRWCSERLFQVEEFEDFILDPACGLGRIVSSAIDAGYGAFGHDKVKRSDFCLEVHDFLTWQPAGPISTVASNPPFGITREFAEKALKVATNKVALLLPTLWLHGDERSRWLASTPLAKVLILTPRPSMPPGPVIEAGIALGSAKATLPGSFGIAGTRARQRSIG
ncbi:MAG: hypothetical protein WDN46_05090 [Methylocella sp.]